MSAIPVRMSSNADSDLDFDREVRFAVVMYGGVSLAIYINGVAQELLHLVQSTRKTGDLSTFTGSERIYGLISYLLSSHEDRAVWEKKAIELLEARNKGGKSAKNLEYLEEQWRRDSENIDGLRTRFVVDILSGTSAGGINGIFLAKAIANRQRITALQGLWVSEGDVDSLINDRKSTEGVPIGLNDPPQSLLNSQRLYYLLLKALDNMESEPASDEEGPDLDLFVTTTDIDGLTLPIRLADKVVFERRHRNVFHFMYRDRISPSGQGLRSRNDFRVENNPFLAYAARCTSSFPFAFEPMTLHDTDRVPRVERNRVDSHYSGWTDFYDDYLHQRDLTVEDYQSRPFGDGGYLDNKPFSYVTEALMRRTDELPVERKLLYIEPSPEHPELEDERKAKRNGKPDVIENSAAALFSLPRYETIREDLQRVRERNRRLERIRRAMLGVELEVKSFRDEEAADEGSSEKTRLPLSDEEWATKRLRDMKARHGWAYEPYQRIEADSVAEDLAALIARIARLPEDSDFVRAIFLIILAWRDLYYSDNGEAVINWDEEIVNPRIPQALGRTSMNQFLWSFNLAYPLRRLNFLRRKVDQLFYLKKNVDNDAMQIVWKRGHNVPSERFESFKRGFRAELRQIKKTINNAYYVLKDEVARLRMSPVLKAKIDALIQPPKSSRPADKTKPVDRGIVSERDMRWLLGEPDPVLDGVPSGAEATGEREGIARAHKLLRDRIEVVRKLNEIAGIISGDVKEKSNERLEAAGLEEEQKHFPKGLKKARRDADRLFTQSERLPGLTPEEPPGGSAQSTDPAWIAWDCIHHFYTNYDEYDMILLPLQYGTDFGEAAQVAVIRVSPEDAIALIDERGTLTDESGATKNEADACLKLAGTALGHFGAFLSRNWRRNDILWGRLDGAERLISALLSDAPNLAKVLTGEAQSEIVLETISPAARGRKLSRMEIKELLCESAMRTKSRQPQSDIVGLLVDRILKGALDKETRKELVSLIDVCEFKEHYLATFEQASRLPPKDTLRTIARATTVTGKILDGIAEKQRQGEKLAAWVTRIGRILWGLVEVSIPRSIPYLIFHHWLGLVYLFDVLLIVVGIIFFKDALKAGFIALGVTLVINLAQYLMTDWMESKLRRHRIWKWLLATIFLAVFILGVDNLVPQSGKPDTLVNLLGEAFQKPGLLPKLWDGIQQLKGRPVAGVAACLFGLVALSGLPVIGGRMSRWAGRKISSSALALIERRDETQITNRPSMPKRTWTWIKKTFSRKDK